MLTEPTEGSAATTDTVRASATTSGGSVRFLLDGKPARTDTSAPYSADLSTAGLADGRHTVSAVQCRSDGKVCDSGRNSTAGVAVSRLHPRIVGQSTRLLSPAKDGRNDTATIAYRLETRQAVTLRVRNAAGAVVRSRSLGTQPAGTHRTSWDGRRAGGGAVRSWPLHPRDLHQRTGRLR